MASLDETLKTLHWHLIIVTYVCYFIAHVKSLSLCVKSTSQFSQDRRKIICVISVGIFLDKLRLHRQLHDYVDS